MILKVQVPAADAAFRSGVVAKWHKQEGDTVLFGDDLCDVAIDQFMALQRTKRAALLGSASKLRRRRIKDAYDLRDGRGVVHMRLTSAEGGVVLGKIIIAEGGRVDIGGVVGILADDTISTPPETAEIAAAAEARIAVNMPDAADLDPFD